MERIKALIMGAAGRDFHNFNLYFRDNDRFDIKAFTATQIPDISDRRYPPELAGKLYPEGIKIYPEENLKNLIKEMDIEKVYFCYSDVPHMYVMHKASLVQAAGADFILMGPEKTMVKSTKPVVSICAIRTGCGKSQTTSRVAEVLQKNGKKVVAVRHPMPYGDLVRQRVQRFGSIEDLTKHNCTIEEQEEYERHINNQVVVYAGVDYEAILREAEKEADVVLWDGGNNDMPFYRSDLEIVVTDPHRAGHELNYYPGETNLIRADVIVINKMDTAKAEDIQTVKDNISRFNPTATVVEAHSPLTLENSESIANKKVLVVEDGPTLTHGEMKFGAAYVAAERYKAGEIIDPRPYLQGKIKDTFASYPNIGTLLPAMGYGDEQIHDLEATINAVPCDLVVSGTPMDLNRIVSVNKPILSVGYRLQEIGDVTLDHVLAKFF